MKSQQGSLIQAVENNDLEKVQDILQDSSSIKA